VDRRECRQIIVRRGTEIQAFRRAEGEKEFLQNFSGETFGKLQLEDREAVDLIRLCCFLEDRNGNTLKDCVVVVTGS
jgi:hypothetical protein